MQLQLDPNKVYAIALEGGGAKGAYEVGAWRALEQAGIRYNAVAGTSVGALNGAMMAMRALEKAETLWRTMRFSMVMDVDDTIMNKVMSGDWKALDMKSLAKWGAGIIKAGGFDVGPLQNLLKEAVDEDAVRASDVDLYLVTVSITDRKALEVRAKDLEKGTLHDMLLASAYLPAFKSQKLGGKRYADGGFSDALPYDVLLRKGYKDIIAMHLPGGMGREKRVRIPKDVSMTTLAPHRELGNILNFTEEQSNFDMQLGYYDAQRLLYGLQGRWYYLERTWTESQAYDILSHIVEVYCAAQEDPCSLYRLHTQLLPAMAAELEITGDVDYYDLLVAYLECMGRQLGIPEFRTLTDAALYDEICASDVTITNPDAPSCTRYMALRLRREDGERAL